MVQAGVIRTTISILTAAALLAVGSRLAGANEHATLEQAQHLFYNGRYDAAAELALKLQLADIQNLAAYELRTSALHFQLRAALGDLSDKEKAFKQCATCPALLKTFLSDIARGRAIAHERLRASPGDDETLFFLGKIDLNFVWLQLETLGRRTGWNEYWEARKSLDAALRRNPANVRARVARAWVDYIVDTKMTRGTRWVLGGGSKKRAFAAARAATSADAEYFAHVEAEFALWEMLVREKNLKEAIPIAEKLARDFPENRRLAAFLNKP